MNLSPSISQAAALVLALSCSVAAAAGETPALPSERLAVTPSPSPAAAAPVAAAPLIVSSPGGLPEQPKSQNATINLIHRLVKRGILTEEDSAELIQQAEQDAADAREQAATAQNAAAQAAAAAQAVAAVQAAAEPPDADLANDPLAPMLGDKSSPDAVRVTYIPENVRAQMRDEIKSEVLAQARDERWAAPNALPDWVSRMRLFGDVRVRGQGDFFPNGNDNTGAFPNFNAINTGSPFDVSGTVFSPQLNVDQDRYRVRLRARFGVEADLAEGFTAGIRIGTGETNSPVSENQSLGVANNGQGGNFSKYAIWLDRGYLKYEIGGEKWKLSLTAGRFDNPFFATTVLWADDLAFDGVALQSKAEVARGVTPFFTAGAFPVFNTDFNFSSNQPAKFKSEDKWLYATQIGTDWRINQDFSLKLAGAYYHFDNIEGHLSSPFTPLNSSDQGDTDDSRPAFAQKGNTYMPLRDIVPNASNNFGATNQFQYFGLASRFRELAFTGKLDYAHYEPFHIMLIGEYVRNIAFERGDIDRVAVNNRGGSGRFDGGNNAWTTSLRLGSPNLEKRWNWNVGLGYRYVESDAVVDGFTDSDFGGGGTNLKGYTLSAAVALSPNVSVALRWMSAQEIAGPPFKEDTIQLDFNGKF